jgi:hypothetical protein
MESSQDAGKAKRPDHDGESDLLRRGGEPKPELAISREDERIYGDAGSGPAQSDVQRLCLISAEVGRAILTRRKQADGKETVNR